MAKSKKKKHNSFFGARLTSTISTSLVLFLLGIIALLGVMATQLTVYVRGNMGFSVVLDENVTDAQIKTLQKRLTAAPYARKVQYISKSDALKELYMELGENPEDLLGYNPLRPSFEVKLNSDYADATKLAGIDKTLRSAYPYIENVSYQKDLIELVNDNLKLIGLILLGIAVVMTVISVVLIANTVSLVAYSKRFLLHAMVLVGATPAFIRRPFVRSHIVNGIFGALIANAAVSLGMNVCGYDPYLSVDAAWRLSRDVKHEVNLDGIYAKADYISINVPYTDQTFHMLDARAFSKMKDGVRIINESRAEIVDDDAMLAAIASGRVGKYVTDFPNEKVVGVDNIIALPHLGACTPESEEKSAVMAARELYDYLANGNIKNSVNFPDATLERMGVSRVCILHQNVPTMLNQFLEITCSTGLNVENMINKAYGAYAYAMIDLNGRLDDDQVAKIDRIPEVIRVRVV